MFTFVKIYERGPLVRFAFVQPNIEKIIECDVGASFNDPKS